MKMYTLCELSYTLNIQKDKLCEQFSVKVTIIDIGGHTVSKDVLVTIKREDSLASLERQGVC